MNEISRRKFLPLIGIGALGLSCVSISEDEKQGKSNIILPKRLTKGAVIGICAPAGAVRSEEDIIQFEAILTQLGYETKRSAHVSERFGYFSATDEDRAADFMSLIADKEVQAIFFARGGWGTARVLEYLNFDVIKNNPKIIMGFSDITTLLTAITVKTGLITFHGPGGNSSWNSYSVHYIKALLENAELVKYENTSDDSEIIIYANGTAEGELFGGNLSVLTSLMGSDYLPNWEGKILFLEDVLEEPYRIDRMLTQLKLNGVFEEVSGVILGSFRKCIAEEPEISFTLEEVFEQHFSKLNIPVYFGAQIGHTRNKFTVPVGAKVVMDSEKGMFELLTAAVRNY